MLVGALIVKDADEIFAITSAGVVIRMSVAPLRYLSRATSGVKLVQLDNGTTVVAVAHNGEAAADVETAQDELPGEVLAPVETGAGVVEVPAPDEPEDGAGVREVDDELDADEPIDRSRPDDDTTEPSADAGDSDEETDA